MIQFKEVSFSYSDETAMHSGVQNINLTIRKGECVLLCGSSGCGKTTLLKLMNGLIPHYFQGRLSGSLYIEGHKTEDTPLHTLSHFVGTVFQNPKTQFFNVDVDSEIVFGAENHGVSQRTLKSRLNQTLHTLHLENLQGRNIFELSGGEKQKVAFASVYHMNPDIYLLDEPSSNLDAAAIKDLRAYLYQLKSEGKTVVIAEHRLYYCLDFADRILYLNNGRIEHDFSSHVFQSLSNKQRIKMGLRAIHLEDVHPQEHERSYQQNLLQVNQLTVRRKKRPILNNISFSAGTGEIIGVAGKNGTGKTTLLRTLCGLHTEYTGTFLWNGQPFKDKHRCKRSYMVMQDVNYQLFAESVEAECGFGIQNADQQRIEQTLCKLELEQLKYQHPNTLSGGQKQRLAVAVSVICKKEVLIFDEPTSGLDYKSMEQVSELLQMLAQNAVVFVVTHDYEFLCKTCTRMIQLEDGAISMDIPVCQKLEAQLRKGIQL